MWSSLSGVLFSVSCDIVRFQAVFVPSRKHNLSTTADIPPCFCSGRHTQFPPPFPPFLKLSDRKCFTPLDFEQSAQTLTNCPSSIFLVHCRRTRGRPPFALPFFLKRPAVSDYMMSSENYAENKVSMAARRWNTQHVAQRDLLTLTTEPTSPMYFKGLWLIWKLLYALCKATAL